MLTEKKFPKSTCTYISHDIKPSCFMAALSIRPLCHRKHNPIPILSTKIDSRLFTRVSCQNRDPKDHSNSKPNKVNKEDKVLTLKKFLSGLEKHGKGFKDNLSPKHKGDWKDITLMSISFAVYVYVSQKLVCAYCVWMSMVGQP